MATSEKKKAYDRAYNDTHVRQIKFSFSLTYDADVIEMLDSVPNKQGYIKALIRADIARAKSEAAAEPAGSAQSLKEGNGMKLYEGYTNDGRRVEIILEDGHIWTVDAATGEREQYNDEWYCEDDISALAQVKASMIEEGYRF